MIKTLKKLLIFSTGLVLVSCFSNQISEETDSVINTTGLEGSEIAVSDKEYDQQNPTVLYIKEDNVWFTVWEDYRNGNADIYGRIIKSDGTLCNEIPLVVHPDSEQTYPTLAYKENDKILLAWQDSRGTSTQGFIYYSTIDISTIDLSTCPSLTLSSETPAGFTSINGDLLVSRKKPKATYNSADDKFYITWIESRSKQKWFSANCFSTSVVNAYTGDTEFVGFASIDSASLTETNGILRTDFGSFPGVDTTGRVISISKETTKEIYTFEAIDQIENPVVSADQTSNEVIFVWEGIRKKTILTCVWTDRNSDNTVDPDEIGYTIETNLMDTFIDEYPTREHKHIYALFLKNKNNAIYSYRVDNVSVMDNSENDYPYDAYYPSVAFDPVSKRFFVAWEINDYDRTNPEIDNKSKIYGQLIYSGGGLYGTNILLSYEDRNNDGNIDEPLANSKQTRPFVSYDPVNQRFFVVWQDSRNQVESQENLDIYGQFVDTEGSLRGTNFEIATKPYNQLSPVVSFNSTDNIYLSVWKDSRNLQDNTCGTTNDKPCGSDLYGQRFSLGNPQLTILTENRRVLAPPILDFGSIRKGTIKTLGLILKNTGDEPVSVDCASITGSTFTFNIPAASPLYSCDGNYLELLPSEEARLNITFQPNAEGIFQETLNVQTQKAGTKSVRLTGTSVNSNLTHTETDGTTDNTLDFGNVKTGNSKTLSIIFTNNGNADIKITSIGSLQPPFSIPNLSLPITLSKGESFSLNITFSPEKRGTYIQGLHISTDNPEKSFDITVRGNGVAPVLSVSTISVDFGNVDVGSTITKDLTIENTGNYKLTGLTCILPPGEFKLLSTCPQELDAGNSTTITIEFSPTSIGTKNETLSIKSDGGDVDIDLTGTGTGGVLSISNSNIDFGYVKVGSYALIDVILSNTGNKALTINNINTGSLGSAFSIDLTTPVTLNPGDSVSFKVKFSPTTTAFYTGSFTVESTAGNKTVYVKGHGVQTNITLSATTIDFGDVSIGERKVLSLVIENNSDVDVIIKDIVDINSPFELDSAPSFPYKLSPSDKLVLKVAFSPSSYGTFNQPFDIVTDSGDITVQLTGTGKATDIYITPVSIDFGRVTVGSSAYQNITVRNNGNKPFDIIGCSNNSGIFSVTGCNVQTVSSSSPVTLTVEFSPDSLGEVTDELTIYTNVGNYKISLKGTGKGGILSVSNTDLNFGFVKTGSFSLKEVVITNAGNETITINSINTTNLNPGSQTVFYINGTPTSPVSLNPGDSLTLQVKFSPENPVTYSGSFTVESTVGNKTIYVKGTGIESNLDYPSTLSFGNVNVGEEVEKTIRIKNTSNTEVTILSVYGINPPFYIKNLPGLPLKLAPSEEVILNIVFSPSSHGDKSQTLNIETDSGNINISITGTGVSPVADVSPLSIDFGGVNIESTSTQIVKIENKGNSQFELLECTVDNPAFSITGCSKQEINGGDSVNITVRFSPKELKTYQGELSIKTSVGVFNVQLKGTGKGGYLEISDKSISYGNVTVGTTKTVQLTLRNTGTETITVGSIDISSLPSQFTLNLSTPLSIPAGTEVSFTVSFSPDSDTVFTGSFTIDSNFNDITVHLSGKGYSPSIEIIQPSDFEFGDTMNFLDIPVGETKTRFIRIKNNSDGNVTLKQVDYPASPFEVLSELQLPLTIKPGDYIDIDLRFAPEEAGTFNTSLGLLFDINYEPYVVFLKGNGIGEGKTAAPKGNILFKFEDSVVNNINFGKVLAGKSKEFLMKVKNDGTSDITINQYSLSDTVNFSIIGLNTPFTLQPGEEKEFKIIFLPQGVNTYSAELKLVDNNGAIYQLSIIGTGYPVEITTSSGTVEDYQILTSVPFIQNAPTNVNIITGFRLLITDVTGGSATVSVEIVNLPDNAVFYKIKRNGEWVKLENVLISKNKITFTIQDNSELDHDDRNGIIEDPVVVATPITQEETTPTGTTSQPPSSGTGGCNMGGSNNGVLILTLLAISLALIRRLKTGYIVILLVIPIISACRVGGGADVGNSVEVTASTENVTFIAADIVNIYDSNENGICGDAGDELIFPSEEMLFVTFRAEPINPSIRPSDVRIEKAVLEYIPTNSSYPRINPMIVYIGSTFSFTRPITIEIPVLDNIVKETFFRNAARGEYFVKVTFYLIEINYNKELETDVGFTLDLDYRKTDDAECLP